MKKIYESFLLCLFLFGMSYSGYAQPGTYIKNLGVCSRYSSVDNDSSIYMMLNNTIVRTDYEGKIIFRQQYDADMTGLTSCSSGGIAAIHVDSQSVILSRINTSGVKVWQEKILNGHHLYPNTVKECSDKGFLIAVNSDSVIFVRTDSLGKVILRSKAIVNTVGEPCNIIETAENNLYVLISGSVFKLNRNGQILWQKSYDNPFKLLSSENNGFTLLEDEYLRKMDSEGKLVWQTTIPGKIISAIKADSCYLVSTSTSVLSIDNNKNVLWISQQTLFLSPISSHKDKIFFLNPYESYENLI